MGITIIPHFTATRVVTSIAFGLKNNPFDATFVNQTFVEAPYIFYPYYLMLYASGVYHTIFGVYYALSKLTNKSNKDKQDTVAIINNSRLWKGVAFVAAVVSVATVGAMSGHIYDIPDPPADKMNKIYALFGAKWK